MARVPMEELEVYRRACELSDEIYFLVKNWGRLDTETIGIQLVRAVDSIGSNLVEGDGRSTDADAKKFFGYSRASGREARHWLRRAKARNIVAEEDADRMIDELTRIVKMIHKLIDYRAQTVVKEEARPYQSEADPFL